VAASIENRALDDETSRWLMNVGGVLRQKLAKVGLITELVECTLGPFVDDYIEKRSNLKPATIRVLELAKKNLVDYFGGDKLLRQVTAGDAADFREALKKSGLAESTTRKRCSVASQIFRYALKHELVSRNPFDEVPKNVMGSSRRQHVAESDANKVCDQLVGTQWKLLFALSRWGGLRVGSEVRLLRWGDIDWESNRLLVHSPKTEHHEGRASRLLPMFPELRERLQAVLDELLEDFDPKCERLSEQLVLPMLEGRSDSSLRKPLERAIKAAGVTQWTRLWHSLRASRQTDLTREFPTHVVCGWLGNTEKVARENYLSTTDEDFDRATRAKVARNGVATARKSEIDEPENRSQPLVLQEDASDCETVQDAPSSPGGTRTMRGRPLRNGNF